MRKSVVCKCVSVEVRTCVNVCAGVSFEYGVRVRAGVRGSLTRMTEPGRADTSDLDT